MKKTRSEWNHVHITFCHMKEILTSNGVKPFWSRAEWCDLIGSGIITVANPRGKKFIARFRTDDMIYLGLYGKSRLCIMY